jgi:hypothetical protein
MEYRTLSCRHFDAILRSEKWLFDLALLLLGIKFFLFGFLEVTSQHSPSLEMNNGLLRWPVVQLYLYMDPQCWTLNVPLSCATRIENGDRLSRPSGIGDYLWGLVTRCWSHQPEDGCSYCWSEWVFPGTNLAELEAYDSYASAHTMSRVLWKLIVHDRSNLNLSKFW